MCRLFQDANPGTRFCWCAITIERDTVRPQALFVTVRQFIAGGVMPTSTAGAGHAIFQIVSFRTFTRGVIVSKLCQAFCTPLSVARKVTGFDRFPRWRTACRALTFAYIRPAREALRRTGNHCFTSVYSFMKRSMGCTHGN
jgi:hypothetical protein